MGEVLTVVIDKVKGIEILKQNRIQDAKEVVFSDWLVQVRLQGALNWGGSRLVCGRTLRLR